MIYYAIADLHGRFDLLEKARLAIKEDVSSLSPVEDTFAWHEGRLVIGVFDDTQGKALRFIEVLGDGYAKKRDSSKGRVPRPSVV